LTAKLENFWLFLRFFAIFAIFRKKCQKMAKKGQKTPFFGGFFPIFGLKLREGGYPIFCVNLINALFSPQNPIFTTLDSKPISTKFSGFLTLFWTPKNVIFRHFSSFFRFFSLFLAKKKIFQTIKNL